MVSKHKFNRTFPVRNELKDVLKLYSLVVNNILPEETEIRNTYSMKQ